MGSEEIYWEFDEKGIQETYLLCDIVPHRMFQRRGMKLTLTQVCCDILLRWLPDILRWYKEFWSV